MIRPPVAAPVALLLVLTGCGGGSEPATAAKPSPSVAAQPSTPDSNEGRLTLESGVSVFYRCVGRGSPSILLEAGGGAGTQEFGSSFVDPLAKATKVCTYDRLGIGSSDPAPDRHRTIDDLCDVEDQVRQGLGLDHQSVLAGQSAGANQVIWCAARRPTAVAALVSIEGYHDDPAALAREFGPDGGWQNGDEHVDSVKSSVMLEKMPRPIGKFPVLVISASNADPGGVKNQRYWLALSPRSRQVVLQGGHDLHFEVPDQVAAEILHDLPR
jgi:pimeloyl-ACP methyl ester carboxylesterase